VLAVVAGMIGIKIGQSYGITDERHEQKLQAARELYADQQRP
jgi:hypothetical protein